MNRTPFLKQDGFVDEIESSVTYPSKYTGPNPIEKQISVLAEILLGLDPSKALERAKNLPELPAGAEGWFAILSDAGLQKLFPHVTDKSERYHIGVRWLVLEKLAISRSSHNYNRKIINPSDLTVHKHTAEKLAVVAKDQPGDILIVAAQLGMRHRGRSERRVRECFDENEFGLGVLPVGSIILTHPNRLVGADGLDMRCSGDRVYSPGADLHLDEHIPGFFVSNLTDAIELDSARYDFASAGRGSVTAFLP